MLQDMIDGYIKCIRWTEEDGILSAKNLDNANFATETMDKIKADCSKFLEETYRLHLLMQNPSRRQLGHDFWLTRNEHGAGFWDYPEVYGEKASKILSDMVGHGTEYPPADVWVDDDDSIYIM